MKTKFKKILNIIQSLIQYIKTKAPSLISSATAACALLFALLPTKALAWAYNPPSAWNKNHNYKPYPPNPIIDPIDNAFTIALFICIVLYIIFYLKNKIEDIVKARKKNTKKKNK